MIATDPPTWTPEMTAWWIDFGMAVAGFAVLATIAIVLTLIVRYPTPRLRHYAVNRVRDYLNPQRKDRTFQ